jgi:hypothetical protein
MYLQIVERMLASQGQRLYIGAELGDTRNWPTLEVASSESVDIPASDRDSARMFLMNLRGWRNQPFIAEHYSTATIDQLQRALEELTASDSANSSTVFGRRRLVMRKPMA